MPIKSVKVFECLRCKIIHRKKSLALACVKQHEVDDEVERIKEEEGKTLREKQDWFRFNIDNPTSFAKYLEDALKLFGYSIVITDHKYYCAKRNFAKDSYGKKPLAWKDSDRDKAFIYISGTVSGLFVNTDKIKNSSFFDIGRCIRGLEIGGGSGGEKFNVSYNYYLEDFPKINELHSEHMQVLSTEIQYQAERKALLEEYNEHYEALKLSDINYQYLSAEVTELEENLNKFKKLLYVRGQELDYERDARTKPKIEFDAEKSKILKQIFKGGW